MAKENKALTLEQHQEMAVRLNQIEATLEHIQNQAGGAYGDQAMTLIRNTAEALDKIRTFLDVRVFIENPDRDGNANAAVYYHAGDKMCLKKFGEEHGAGCDGGCGHDCGGKC